MATYYAGSEPEFSSAIQSGTYPISIYVTQNFTGNSSYLYSIYGAVTIASNAATPYTIQNINIMAGEDSALSLMNITLDGTSTDAVPAVENYGDMSVDGNTTIRNYRAPAIFNGQPGTVAMNGILEQNTNPSGNGGGIENYSDVTIDSGIIQNNSAQNGGGIWNSSDTAALTLNGGVIQGNTATYGGGIYNDTNATLNMTRGRIEYNTAANGGGIYSVPATTLAITGGTIDSNTSNGGDGGGIYLEDGAVAGIDGSVSITANTTDGDGGGIYTPYENLYNLSVGAGVSFMENSAAYKANIVPDDEPLYDSQISASAFSDEMPNGYNNYDIAYNRVITDITAQKQITGGTMQYFTFHLQDGSGTTIATVQNDEDGNIIFPDLVVDTMGPYVYTISEDLDPIGGFVPDENAYPVTVTTTVDGSGFLTAAQDIVATVVNTYDPTPVDVVIAAAKTASGAGLSAGQFTFHLAGDDGSTYDTTNNADGSMAFPPITFTEEGAYHYTITETSPGGDGWTTDTNTYGVDVTVTDDGAGNLLADIRYSTADGNPPVFQNTYSDAPTSLALTATKEAIGAGLSQGQFSFILEGHDGTSYTATNNADGSITFPAITYTAAGNTTYTIRETTPAGGGWAVDTRIFIVVVTVTDNGDGTLSVSTVYNTEDGAPPVFTNVYTPSPVEATITAAKNAVGKALQGGEFTALLVDEDGNTLTAANDADGNFTFTSPLPLAGTYTYTLSESPDAPAGWTTDGDSYVVTVVVSADGDGNLQAAVTYGTPDGNPPVFTNIYTESPVSVSLSGTKTATGRALSGGDFTFGVYDGGTLITSAANAADGSIIFPAVSYAAAGTHNYTIREITQPGNGWTTDSTAFPAIVTITSDNARNLSAAVEYPSGVLAFHNSYQASPVSVSLSATKLAFGKTPAGGEFTFGVFDSAGNLKSSASNAADGSVAYPPITFAAPGTYYYYLQEITPSGGGWTTDTRKDPVVITVTDSGQGALEASVLYPFGAASFRNQYGASPAIVTPTATKTATGAALPAGKFTFGLYNHDTGALVDTATNTGSGNITFDNLTFAEPGAYTYQVREITPSTGGWTTDPTVFTAVITVTDDGTGNLTSTIAFSPEAPAFHNAYDPSDASEDIFGYKVLENWSGEEVPFDFALTDADGSVVATTQNSDGVIHFTTSVLTAPGTYRYTLRETSSDGNGWTTDKNAFAVTVTVTDNGAGKLISTVDYPDGTPTFINTYQTTPADLVLTGTKTAVGKALSGNDFIFGVFDENGNIRASAYNNADGTITFPAIFFDKAGTVTYTVRELSTDGEGWVTDKNEYPVTIEVVDNGDGTFSISTVRYTRGMPTFTNTYHYTPVSVRLYAAKYASGKTMAGGDFDFAVEDAQGAVKAAAENDEHGSVSFPAIAFDQPGVYVYTILETTPPGHGWMTDTTLIPVTITVTDSGQGALNAAISYPDGVPHFYNVYTEHTVHFTPNGGSSVSDQRVPYGDPAQKPADPTRGGYSFRGWFADAALIIPYDFSQPVTADVTLYAAWTSTGHEVVFDSNGGSAIPPQLVANGEPAQQPADPTREGYTFCGWFADAALTIPYDFSLPVTADVTLYACWQQLPQKVLAAHKELQCAQLAAGQFHFTLCDRNGNALSTAANDAEGNIYFDNQVFEAGTHIYFLRETIQNCLPGCYHYDLRSRRISVTADGDGNVTVENPPTFVNCYVGGNTGNYCNRVC